MLQKIIYIIFILNTFTVYSYGAHISEYNETNVILTIYSQLSDIRTGQEKLTNEVAKDIQFIRAEIERQKKCELDKETETQSSRVDIQSLRDELEHQKKDILEKDSSIQSLRADIQVFKTDIQSHQAELEQQKKYILDKEADNQSLRADMQNLRVDLEQQKKFVLDKEADNQILRAELERQEKLKDGLVKESNQLNSTSTLRNCVEAKSNGIHDIVVPKFSNQPFKVACDAQTREGGWTIILRRLDGSVNFTRNWEEYKKGFGNLDGEYFLGLDKIHAMTAERFQELLIVLEDFEGHQRFETYDDFAIGDESQQYKLHTLGEASGTAGDSLGYHRDMKFTTFDKDNDNWNENCAIYCTGAWWYNGCQYSQLTGTYKDNGEQKGVNWILFRGYKYSLKTAIMMIRPKK